MEVQSAIAALEASDNLQGAGLFWCTSKRCLGGDMSLHEEYCTELHTSKSGSGLQNAQKSSGDDSLVNKHHPVGIVLSYFMQQVLSNVVGVFFLWQQVSSKKLCNGAVNET